MSDFVNIFTWVSMAGVLAVLVTCFFLVRKISRLGNINAYAKSVILTVFFVGVLGVGYYFVWSPSVSPNNSVIKFPSTGPGPTTPVIIQFIINLYATPISGLVTTALLTFIIFVTIKIIRPDTRKIKKDLEDAKIAARNVLEDLQAEKQQLAEAKARVDAILYNIGDGVFVINSDYKIATFNKAAAKISGFSSEEAIGRNYRDILKFVRESDDVISDDFITKTIQDGVPRAMEGNTLLVTKDGRKIPVADSATPLKNSEGRTIGCVVVFHDTTEEKELDRAKTEFISIASHQLRTPVSGLSWLTEALQFTSKNLTVKQKIYVRDLAMLSKRLVVLVEDLLNISRIELKTPIMTEKASVEVVSFIQTFIKEIKPYADSKEHTIIFNNKVTEPVILEINKKSLYNVLQNLVSNGIEYSPDNTAVAINLEKKDDFIKTTVSNKGPAIPSEEQLHIFERFYRAESAKKMKAEGTGLGLYIIKMIIEEMGGTVGFESGEGKDTAFWFSIPLKNNKN